MLVWCLFIIQRMITDTHAKTLRIGVTMSANRQPVTQTNLALNILKKMVSKDITQEQQITSDRSFVIRCLAVGILFIVIIFGYSVVKEAQPLFSESPTDKAIIAVLSLILGQAIQIIANYLNSSKPLLPTTPCPPSLPVSTLNTPTTTINTIPKPITPVAPVASVTTTASKSNRIADDD